MNLATRQQRDCLMKKLHDVRSLFVHTRILTVLPQNSRREAMARWEEQDNPRLSRNPQ